MLKEISRFLGISKKPPLIKEKSRQENLEDMSKRAIHWFELPEVMHQTGTTLRSTIVSSSANTEPPQPGPNEPTIID